MIVRINSSFGVKGNWLGGEPLGREIRATKNVLCNEGGDAECARRKMRDDGRASLLYKAIVEDL